MIVAVHQPQYLPWLGYFDKIDQADIFVILDNVQYKKNEYQNRNRIKTAQGWQWITVPVKYRFPEKIIEVAINNEVDWRRKHHTALLSNYNRSAYFKDYRSFFEDLYQRDWILLANLNTYIIEYIIKQIKIATKIVKASDLELSSDPTQRLIDICKGLGADTYLAGAGGREYMDVDSFEKSGIKVVFQEFQHPVYEQLYGKFESYMSVVDLLFNHGPKSMEIISKYRKK